MKLAYLKSVVVLLLGVLLVQGSARSMTIKTGTGGAELIKPGDQWRFFRGITAPSTPADAWRGIDFNDSGWELGESGFGYGDNDDATVLSDMQDHYTAVYIRKEFTVSGLAPDAVVQLIIDYDDGFIAYINGDWVAQEHVTVNPDTGQRTASSHEAGTPQVVELGTVGEVLQDGVNVIAIEGHNASLGSTDFSLIPALRTVGAVVLTEDTTWSGSVLLEDNILVPAGIVLTIEPGTVVLMADGVLITVKGRLLANGTDAEPIQFTHSGGGTAWKQIMFIEAADSRLAHCIIEYSACEGDHKDYYDNDCDDGTPPLPRTYHEAVVSLASHVDIEGCTFQHLLGGGTNAEGDAIAIISDDPNHPGEASANIRNCQFLSIGQGVHTRYAYVLVEDCYFTGKRGDNDHVDLVGESTPAPVIRNNLFTDSHDDMVHPTACSAIIVGNVIWGCDDHGVVLRDKCYPVVMNNLIYDCTSGGIAVQNQCDALLINNTIVNCGRGIRFFDHTDRWGPPYCLTPGSGKATVVNCIIWDSSPSFELADSPYTGDRGSHATVLYCDVEGTTSVSANSTLTWGAGNINIDPQFASTSSHDFHLKSQAGRWNPATESWVTDGVTSPCIDAGTSYLVDDPKYMYSGLIDWRGELWPHGAKINMGAYGGTAQASMSGDSEKGNLADVDYDGLVGLPDYARLAQWWRMERALLAEDLDRNGVVDFRDVLLIGQEWTWQEEP
jgi:hypothetical protein